MAGSGPNGTYTKAELEELRRSGVNMRQRPVEQYSDDAAPKSGTRKKKSLNFSGDKYAYVVPPPPSPNPIRVEEQSQHIRRTPGDPGGLYEQQPQQKTGSDWNPMIEQAWNNISRVGQGAADLFSEGVSLLSSDAKTSDYVPPPFEEWAAKNAAFKMQQIREARDASRRDVKGVKPAEGERVRQEARETADRLQSELQNEYKSTVEAGKSRQKEHLDQRFSDRYPLIDSAGKVVPALATAAMFRRALKRHKNEVLGLTKSINSGKLKGKRLSEAKETLHALEKKGTGTLARNYIGGGVSATAVPQFVQNLVDRNLPKGSAAREEARYAYSPVDKEGNFNYDGLKRTASDAMGRVFLIGASTGGLGYMTAPKLSMGQAEAARRAAGVRNIDAAKNKVSDNKELLKLRREERSARASEKLHGARTKSTTSKKISELAGSAPVSTSSRATAAAGPKMTAENQAKMMASNRLNAVNRKALTEAYSGSGGKMSIDELQKLAPNLRRQTIEDLIKKSAKKKSISDYIRMPDFRSSRPKRQR